MCSSDLFPSHDNRRLSYIEIAASASLHTLFNMIDIVFNTADKIQNNRTPFEIFAHKKT